MTSVRGLLAVAALLLLLALGGLWIAGPEAVAPPDDAYDRATVTLLDENDATLATVDARVADTTRKRYVGLSATDSLESGEGMLFVHDEEDRYTYVMRGMDFPIDIVFVGTNGTITTVHHAPLPDDGGDARHPGVGKYVLEVPYGYTNETGVEPGDRVEIEGY